MEIKQMSYEQMISRGDSIRDIAKYYKMSYTGMRHRLKKLGLKTNPKTSCQIEIQSGYKTCSKCKIKKPLTKENFYILKSGKFHYWCKDCNNQITYEKQIQRKKEAVGYKGGKCSICGYNKYLGALDFHHLDPSQKEFNIGYLRYYKFEKIKSELDKCILVCKNCHAELHGKLVAAPGLEPGTSPL